MNTMHTITMEMRMEARPPEERPRERCLESGAGTLSLRECLAVLLGTGPRGLGCLGLADRILQRVPREPGSDAAFFSFLESAPEVLLQDIRGLGAAGRARLLVAFELARRYALYRESRYSLAEAKAGAGEIKLDSSSLSLHTLALRSLPASARTARSEWIGFVPWYGDSRLGALSVVEKGVRTHVNFDPADLFGRILALRPLGFFLFHNHPSGSLEPSISDLQLTERVRRLSDELGLRFLGHGIVSPRGGRWVE